MRLSRLNTLLLASLLVPVFAFGSGSGSYGGQTFEKVTDPAYEQGKSIVKGRLKTYQKVKFCIASDEVESGVKKIKGKTMKAYKNGSYQGLVDNLRSCNDASRKATQILKRNDLLAAVYYLDKRFRLKLKYR